MLIVSRKQNTIHDVLLGKVLWIEKVYHILSHVSPSKYMVVTDMCHDHPF